MADNLTYGVTLEDRMSGPAKAASGSLKNLTEEMLKAQTVAGQVKPEPLANSLEGLAASTKKSQKEFKATKEAALATVGAFAAVGAAALAVTGAIGGIVLAGAKFAIAQTQAKQALMSTFDALGQGVTTGEQVDDMLDNMTAKFGVAKSTMSGFTKTLMSQGVTSLADLEKGTLAATSAMAIMGPTGADAFLALSKKIQFAADNGQQLKIPEKRLESLAQMGLSVSDVAKKMNVDAKTLTAQLNSGSVDAKKFGDALQSALVDKGAGPMKRLANSAANLGKLLEDSFGDMFEDLGSAIDPFMTQVRDLFSIFGKSSESGKAMKAGISGAFTFIFNAASKVVPYIKHFFLDLIIYSLKGYIMLKQHWSTISKVLQGLGFMVKAAAIGFGIFVGIIAAGVAVVVAAVAAIGFLVAKVMDIGSSALSAGKDFVMGLVNGITGGVTQVVDAAKNLGSAALKGVKGVLGIASPSTLMMQMGAHTSAGLAEGMTGGAPQVEQSAKQMGGAAGAGAMSGLRASDYTAPASGGGKSGGGGASNTIGPITIQLTAPSGVTNAIELTETAIAALFERLALSQGLA